MKLATALIWALVGAASIAGATLLRPSPPSMPEGSGRLVFPGLADRLGQATRLEITGGDSTGSAKTTTLVFKNNAWGIAERGDFPAQPQKLREVFAGLAELRLIEPRTADPALFARLGVDDPKTAKSTANLLRVEDATGKPMAALILGHRSQRSQGGLPEAVYVRRPSETQSWLAEGRVPADADPQAWLVRDIADIPRARIATVSVTHGAEHLMFTRHGDGMQLADPPAGKLDDYKVDSVAMALEGLTLADVQPSPPPGSMPGSLVGSADITTTDGLVMHVVVNRRDKEVWASFAATGPGSEAFTRLQGWAFQLPEWREHGLVPQAAELMEDLPAK